MTHSYTIMPIISMAGKLLSPLFIVCQEQSGKFGEKVKKHMFQSQNIYVTATKSGKMGKSELKDFLSNVYFKNCPNESVLLFDSWTSYNNKDVIEETVPPEKQVHLFQMPPKVTPLIQPLDVYGFRMWKNFIRKISDKILLNDISFNLYQRNNILKIQALTHNQFQSPRYIKMWQYSWHASGFKEIHPGQFHNPVEFGFSIEYVECGFPSCNKETFAKCSWCKKEFCFHHFCEMPHICERFIF